MDERNVLESLPRRRFSAAKGDTLYDEGAEPDAFYCVETGCVRLQVNGNDGGRQILAFCFPGDIFGLQVDGERETAAEAVIDSTLLRFPLAPALSDASLAQPLLGVSLRLGSTFAHHLEGLHHGAAEERLIWFLDWLADKQRVSHKNGLLRLPMSRRDIADFLSLAPETLSRVFARLEEQLVVRVTENREVLLRPLRPSRTATSRYAGHVLARPREDRPSGGGPAGPPLRKPPNRQLYKPVLPPDRWL